MKKSQHLFHAPISEVHVKDVNDNHPNFRSSYSTNVIMENSSPSEAILTVKAQDMDLDPTLTYHFLENTQNLYGEWFKIDEKDGTISSIKKLDYELLGSNLVLEVVAKDEDELSSKQTNVTINIGNLNDNVPIIDMDFRKIGEYNDKCLSNNPAKKNQTIYLTEVIEIPNKGQNKEEITNASRYFNVTVMDLDGNPNNFVYCEITNKSDENIQLIQVSENQYQVCFSCDFLNEPVYIEELFDREVRGCHFIDVSCTDNGMPSSSSSARLIIELQDLNDNPPSFEYSVYPFTIHTNNLCKSFEVGRVIARDIDDQENSKVGYNIQKCTGLETSDHGRIDLPELQRDIKMSSFRGVVSMNFQEADDCRQFSSVLFRCEIIARNKAPPFHESFTTSYIFIEQTYKIQIGKNEQSKHMFITENQPILSFVGNLRTVMKSRQNYTFSVIEGITRDFKLISNTGDIITKVYLDRELRDTYKFIFKAEANSFKNPKPPRLMHVIIHVLDLNDNAPEFYKPRQDEVLLIHQEGVYARRRVCRVKARDTDVGRNSVLTYQLLNNE